MNVTDDNCPILSAMKKGEIITHPMFIRGDSNWLMHFNITPLKHGEEVYGATISLQTQKLDDDGENIGKVLENIQGLIEEVIGTAMGLNAMGSTMTSKAENIAGNMKSLRRSKRWTSS